MARYMVEISFSSDEYLDTLERMMGESPELMSRTVWGYMLDEPKGWTMVDAASEREARDMLPRNLRDNARIAEVRQISASDIMEMRRRAA